MSNDSLVGVVILNYNNSPDTVACVESLALSTYGDYHVILVDNGSTDGSPQRIRQALPDIELVTIHQNLGFSAGVNIGIDRALDLGAGYVWLLNNDTIVAAECLDHLVTAANNEFMVGITIPKIYYHDKPTCIWSAGARWEAFPPRVTMVGLGQSDSSKYDVRRDLDYATGCAMLVPRHVFETVGAFDPAYFMYQEDYDFCYRVRQAGFRILYIPRSHVWHKVSRTLGENSAEKWYLWSRSAVIFYRRYYSISTLVCFLGWVIMRETLKGSLSFFHPFVRGVRDGMATVTA